MKNAILLTVLSLATASGTLFAQPRFSVGIGIGGEAPQYYDQAPPAYAPAPDYGYDSNESAYDSGSNYDYQPPSPGPGYFWTSGSWYPSGGRRVWRAGYWAPPVYRGYSSGPRYSSPRYYSQGYSRGSQPRGGYQGSYRNNFSGNNRGYSRNNSRNNSRDNSRNNSRSYRENSRAEHRR